MVRSLPLRWLLPGLVAAAAFLVLSGPVVQAAEVLRWKFAKGDVLRYEVKQNMKQNVEANGAKIEMLLDQTYDLSWTVEDVDSQQNARVALRFERIRFKMSSAALNFEFDSDNAENEPDNPVFKPVAQSMKAMLNVRFSFRVDPLGNLSEMKGLEELKKLLPGGAGSQFFSEDSIEQTASQGFVRFSPEPIGQGQGWQKRYDLQMPQLGKITGEENYTLAGNDALDGRECLRIVSRSDVEIAPEKNGVLAKAGATFDIDPIETTYYFDNQTGRLLKSQASQQMQIGLNVGTAEIKMDVTVRLIPEKTLR